MSEQEKIQAAIEEAWASCTAEELPLHTLEFHHQAFSQPARVALWTAASQEITKFSCLLEENAPHDPGAVVEFIGLPFELVMPEKNDSTPGEFQLRVSGIGYELDANLEAACLSGGKITCIYREFLQGAELDGPGFVWPGISIKDPSIDSSTGDMSATGSVLDWVNKAYGELYRPSRWPALSQR